MKAIVTGGGGFIGSNLATTLELQGWDVLVIDNFTSGDFRNLSDFQGDVLALDLTEIQWERFGTVDAIFHQQAITDTTVLDQKRMLQHNLEAFRALLAHCLQKKIPLVYASSAGVYGNEPPPQKENGPLRPLNIYGYSKLLMDRLVGRVAKGAQSYVTGLRYFNVFGPRECYKGKAASMIYQLAEQIRAGKQPRIFEFGEQERDHIYVKDVVAANLCALKSKKTGVYNVGTGAPTTFNRLIEIINEVLGTRAAPEYFKNPYSFYQNHTCAGTELAAREIGYKASWTIEAGIRDYLTGLYQSENQAARGPAPVTRK